MDPGGGGGCLGNFGGSGGAFHYTAEPQAGSGRTGRTDSHVNSITEKALSIPWIGSVFLFQLIATVGAVPIPGCDGDFACKKADDPANRAEVIR